MEDRVGRGPTGRGAGLKLAKRAGGALAIAALFAGIALLWRRVLRARGRTETPADVQAAIDLANRAYLEALENGDAAAYGAIFTDDAISMPARGKIVRGRRAIEASIEGALRHIAFRAGDIRTIETHVDGKTAYELGRYSFDVTADGSAQTLAGRYLVVWRKVRDDWKIAVDASDPTPAA